MRPEIPSAGKPLKELFANKPVDISAVQKKLSSVAREQNLPFGEQKMVFSSQLAQELGKWAEEQGRGEAFHHAVFVAYFGDGKNIGEIGVLIDLCEEIGLDPAGAKTVLSGRTHAAAVDADWEKARQDEIIIIPTFIIGAKRLAGFQLFKALKRLVENAGVSHIVT